MVRSDWHLEQFMKTSGTFLLYQFTITIQDYPDFFLRRRNVKIIMVKILNKKA